MGAYYLALHPNYRTSHQGNSGRRQRRSVNSHVGSSGKVAIILIDILSPRATHLTSKLNSMVDLLVIFGSLAIFLYGLFDCARTVQESVRSLPKWAWLLIIIFFSPFGSIGWFVFGRPKTVLNSRPRRRPGTVIPPDDNPEFLKRL